MGGLLSMHAPTETATAKMRYKMPVPNCTFKARARLRIWYSRFPT
jgi:hypothetical protein